ncbi:MAG: outer membrane protein assembly factor BamE [Planctomycetota bacterium]
MQNRSSLPRSVATVALALALWALPSGCFLSRSRSNPELSPEAVSRIVPGTSTADDVTRLLGAPNEVVQLGRKSAWLYEHTVEKQAAAFLVILGLRGVDTQADRVWVFFDEDGGVINVGTLFQASEAEYDLPIF